ncbi:hypothetical protein [Thermococcus sp.]
MNIDHSSCFFVARFLVLFAAGFDLKLGAIMKHKLIIALLDIVGLLGLP